MKIDKKNFNQFYIQNIQSKLAILEEERKRSLKTCLFFVFASLAISFMFGLNKFVEINPIFILFMLAPTFIVGFISYYFTFRNYRKQYKEKVINLIFKNIFDDFYYRPESHLTEYDYQSTLLYQGNYNRFSGEDFVEGVFKGQDVKMSELQVAKVERRKKKNSKKIIFKGLLILIKVKTPYFSQTIIEPDLAESAFGFIGKALQADKKGLLENVRLESPDFEKNFAVYSSDQIESRKILTPVVQEKLTALKNVQKDLFAFSIHPNQICIAFPNISNQFEPNYFTKVDDVKIVREVFDLFLFVDDLLGHLQD